MDPAQPDPPDATTVPVRRGIKPGEAPPAPPGNPSEPAPEARTLALRPGGLKRMLSEENPADAPAEPPLAPANPSSDATVGYRQIAQVRADLAPPAPPEPPQMEVDRGATVSIHQVKRMRMLLETPAPPKGSDDPPGMTTVPIRRAAGPRLIPDSAPSAPSPDPISPVPDPVPRKPRPSAPGSIKPPAAPVPAGAVDPKLLCPRCQVKLISPESLGMCPSCGYCRSLEEGKDKVPPPVQRTGLSLFGLVEFCQLLGMVPLWCWVLLGGMAAVVLGTIYGPRHFTANGPQRAWWGTAQFVLGLILAVAAQVWAMFAVAAHDDRVSVWDLFLLPARVWRLVLQRLPQSRGPLWMGCWGWTLALSALFLVRIPFTGLTSTEEGLLIRELRSALATMQQEDYRSLQAAARDDLQATADTPAPAEREGTDSRPSKPCAVIGYTKDAEGKPNALIVATPEKGRLRYAGIVRTGLRKSRELLERLGALEKVDGPTEGGAVWVKPELGVDVHHSGTGENGTLNEPNLGGLLQSDKPD